jgi:hypothetical protein
VHGKKNMLNDMNGQNEMLTKDFFIDYMERLELSFTAKMERMMDIKIEHAISELAMLINKSFEEMELRMAKQEDLLVLAGRVEKIEKYLEVSNAILNAR